MLFSWSSWIMNLDVRSSHQAFKLMLPATSQILVLCNTTQAVFRVHSQRAHYHPSLRGSKDSRAAGFVAFHFTDGSLFLLLYLPERGWCDNFSFGLLTLIQLKGDLVSLHVLFVSISFLSDCLRCHGTTTVCCSHTALSNWAVLSHVALM